MFAWSAVNLSSSMLETTEPVSPRADMSGGTLNASITTPSSCAADHSAAAMPNTNSAPMSTSMICIAPFI